MLTIGVTGGIASGKSVVVRVIQEMGFPVFNSDKAAHIIANKDLEVIDELCQLFGPAIYSSGNLDRGEVARRVFQDEELLSRMSALIHPRVRSEFQRWSQNQKTGLVFNEAAILFETASYKNFDKTILVSAPLELRIARAMKRDGVSREEVERRIAQQWPDEEKIKLASFIIKNDDKSPLLMQIENIIEQLEPYSTSS